MDRPLVIDTEDLAATPREWLAERADVRSVGVDDPGFPVLLAQADALVIRTYTQIDAALLDAAPNLKVIGRAGVGLDNLDLPACAARDVTVCYTPEANAGTVTELVFGLLLDVLRPRPKLTQAIDADTWVRRRSELMGTRELGGLAVGVWGFGRVGRRVARVGRAFGMRVRYHDLLDIPADRREGAEPADRDALLAQSDVVTLHVDGRDSNRGLVGVAELAALRKDAILVNAARGFIVDPAALAAWLRTHPDAHAICDVHDPEPLPVKHPLLGVPNALLVPHLGAATRPAKDRMGWVVEDVWRVLEGEAPRWPAPAH